MILNARAENGSLSPTLRDRCCSSLVDAGDGGRSRGRQEVDDGVQHGLHALVLEGGAAEHRNDVAGDRACTDALHDLFFGQLAVFEIHLHQLFDDFGRGFDHEFARGFGFLKHVGRDSA